MAEKVCTHPLPDRRATYAGTVFRCPVCGWEWQLHPVVRRWFRWLP